MAQIPKEAQGQWEDMVNPKSPKCDVFIEDKEHEEEDDPSKKISIDQMERKKCS